MASGDTLFTLLPHGSIPTATLWAPLDVIAEGSTPAGNIPVLDFDGSTRDEHAEWFGIMPSHYDGGGLTVEVHYAMDGTDGSAVQFEVRADKVVAAEDLSSDLGVDSQTATDITDTPSGTANVLDITPTGAITHANAGSPAVGDLIRIRLTRDYDHAVNTDDAQVVAVLVTET